MLPFKISEIRNKVGNEAARLMVQRERIIMNRWKDIHNHTDEEIAEVYGLSKQAVNNTRNGNY